MKGKGFKENESGDLCPRCMKPPALCVCPAIKAVKTKTEVLILQHPQEPDKILGSALIAHLALSNSKLKVGLSWPNLERTIGHETDRKSWAVLYLGNQEVSKKMKEQKLEVALIDKKSQIVPNSSQMIKSLKGIVILDGTWSQAKTLWWRNSWLLKLQRMVLLPTKPSLYGKLRREPRRESLSTIESLALALSSVEKSESLQEDLLNPFRELLKLYGQS